MSDIINLNKPGEDALKGGFFLNSSLVPLGNFSNTPNFYVYDAVENSKIQIELTLKKIKDSIKVELQNQYNYSKTDLNEDDVTVEKFLYELTTLLIDYKDMRNFVFFGSAQTEIAYNIQHIIKTFTYKTLIADLTSSFDEIIITNNNSNNQSTIIFSETTIKDIGSLNFYDSDNIFIWSDYELVDKNGKRYEILNAVAPYSSSSISLITNIQDGVDSIKITTSSPHNILAGQSIEIFDVEGSLLSGENNINVNGKFNIINVLSTSFEIVDMRTNDNLSMNFSYISNGKVRLLPLELNVRPYGFKINISGIITIDELINYTNEVNDSYTGFIISPKQKVLNDFEFNLSPIQKQLLAPLPINLTPWPRRMITNNIQNIISGVSNDVEFVNWLSNPDFLYQKDGGAYDNDVAFSDVYGEFSLLRAAALDESATNQIIRRCIPHDVISELNDADNGYFQRFILIAGWFFDQLYLYIKFIKYTHTLNYGDFNQVSPEFYKYYADHYGFDLFSDDSIDFSKLVVQTEPGLFFSETDKNLDNKYYRNTIQKLQYERQKRLLLSLFYLYRIKGTQACIKTLVSLLGAPDGLLLLQEFGFTFNNVDSSDYITNGDNSKTLIVDNEKVHVPDYHFEIDPDFLIDKSNINNTINQPYVYRMRLHNETTINLRQIGISTDPAQAIDNQIKSIFGKTKSDYIMFNNGEFSSLQNEDSNHYLLPLTLPDKFFGLSVNYTIDIDGYLKGIGNNLEETAVHIGSLILVDALTFKSSSSINNIVLSVSNTVATITTQGNHNFLLNEKIKISNVIGIGELNGSFIVTSIPDNTTIEVIGFFSGSYISGGIIEHGTPNKLPVGFNTTYCLPEVFSNYNEDTILNPTGTNPITDFDLLFRNYPSSNFLSKDNFQYIFTRLEGNDLVVRLKLSSETQPIVIERVAIFKYLFNNDGLNHNIRLLFRAEGIEVYQDYEFKGLAKWLLPDTNDSGIPYLAFEIPKKDILTCTEQIIPINDLIAVSSNTLLDKIKWWDLLIGLPQNINFYFQKIEYFENTGIGDYNIGDKIVDSNNSNADSYIFEFKQSTLNGNKVTTNSQFVKANPVNDIVDYSGVLPESLNQNNALVITDLNLTSKSFNPSGDLSKFFNSKQQDFFKDDNIFQRVAWQNDIHKSYEYKNLNGKVLKLNNIYSPQVLTYESLLDFLGLIENKFKKTIQQFIPIVINISEFGRLIKSSMFNQHKIRYTGIHKDCKGEQETINSFFQSKIFDTTLEKIGSYSLSIKNGLTDIVSPITVLWQGSKINTIAEFRNNINVISNNPYFPKIKASILTGIFRIEIDYKYFIDNSLGDPNNFTFLINDGTNFITIPFANGLYGYDHNSYPVNQLPCFTIEVKIPSPELIDQVYIYYNSESTQEVNTYYNSENNTNTFIE